MANTPSSAVALDLQPLSREIISKGANTIGTILLTMMAGLLIFAAEMSAPWRTGIGLAIAAAIIGVGELLTRRSDSDYAWWSGTSLMSTGYLLALLMAHSSYYVTGAPALDAPYACWLLKLSIVGVLTLHASRNSILRWACLPITVAVSGHVLWTALGFDGTVSLFGMTVSVPAAACVIGMFWWMVLSLQYKRLHAKVTGQGDSDALLRQLYKISDLVCFFLSLACAMWLPKVLSSLDYAPIWWSAELPLLLAVCWRSNGFGKHALIMALWAMSTGLMFFTKLPLDLLWYMTVPASGIAMGLTYRLLNSHLERSQKLLGYCFYTYGAVLVALVVPFFKLGLAGSMPVWLFEAGALLALSIALRDRALHWIALGVSAAAVAVYGAHRHEWAMWLMLTVVAGGYGMCFVYSYINKKGGWLQSEPTLVPSKFMLRAREARWLEFGAAAVGFAAWFSGSIFLMKNPTGDFAFASLDFWIQVVYSNTFAWWLTGFFMIFYGLRYQKLEHRFFGVGSWCVATGKMWAIDLAMSTKVGPVVGSLLCASLCLFGIARLYKAAADALQAEANDDSSDEDGTPPTSGGSNDQTGR